MIKKENTLGIYKVAGARIKYTQMTSEPIFPNRNTRIYKKNERHYKRSSVCLLT